MSQFVIRGGQPLSGEIAVSGSKNAVLPMIAASLLTDEEVVLENVPDLRDVAGMLRSIDYLAADAIRRRGPMAVPVDDRAFARAELWRQQSRAGFLEAYNAAIEGSPTHPDNEAFARDLLDLFLIQKAAYEVSYELANRPTWVDIPLRGLLDLVNDKNGAGS